MTDQLVEAFERGRAEGYAKGLKTAQRDHFNGGMIAGVIATLLIQLATIGILMAGGWL